MALLRSLALKRVVSANPVLLYNSTRRASHYIEDYLPGPYPKTEEERLAAAKKYNLLPHEYEPYPDDGFGKGDYPKLPDISTDEKDPYYPWDMPEYRRNFGEVYHAHYDILNDNRYDGTRKKVTRAQAYTYFLLCLAFVFGTGFLLEPYPLHRPASAPQLVADKVHYSFERGA